MHLADRFGPWALITGASSGIGREFAIQLAREGLNLVLVARRQAKLQEVANECEKSGIETHVCVADLAKPAGVEYVAQAIGDRDVGLLVNNAGIIARGAFHEIDSTRQHDMMYLNAVAPMMLARLLLPPMIERKRGAIVMVSSTSAHYFHPWMATYATSKQVSSRLGEYLAWELKNTGVNCLVLTPGATATELFESGSMNITSDTLPPGYSLQPADRVVQKAIKALGRKETLLVTSFAERVTMWLSSWMPAKLMRFLISTAAGELPVEEKNSDLQQ